MGALGGRNGEALERNLEAFQDQWPNWKWLPGCLRKSGLEPTSARKLSAGDQRSSWVFLAHLEPFLQERFELAPEVLVLCTPRDGVQTNEIACAEEMFRREVGVDPGFVLVITHDPDAKRPLDHVVLENHNHLFVRDETLESTEDPLAFLHGLLRDVLWRRRSFDLRSPAAGPQFFGREGEIEALERDVLSGHCLGVFGLRKVGKTSLLRRVAEKFRERAPDARRVIPIEVDLQVTGYRSRNFDGVAKLIGWGLDREVARSQIRVPSLPADPLDRLAQMVEHAERALKARVLLILDEYEVLLGGRIPPSDGVELLTWLRGMAQTHPRSFGLVLVGRNPKLLAPARIEGADNPMYRFLRSVPLSGLTPEECQRMVSTIGRRTGLRFLADALDLIVQETGGHPALVRTLGDLVDEHVPASERSPAIVDEAVVAKVLPRFSREVDEDMRELVNASNDIDPRAGDYLVHLAHGVPWIGGPSEARIEDALVAHGILHADTHEFRIGRMLTWLRENHASPAKAAHG